MAAKFCTTHNFCYGVCSVCGYKVGDEPPEGVEMESSGMDLVLVWDASLEIYREADDDRVENFHWHTVDEALSISEEDGVEIQGGPLPLLMEAFRLNREMAGLDKVADQTVVLFQCLRDHPSLVASEHASLFMERVNALEMLTGMEL